MLYDMRFQLVRDLIVQRHMPAEEAVREAERAMRFVETGKAETVPEALRRLAGECEAAQAVVGIDGVPRQPMWPCGKPVA